MNIKSLSNKSIDFIIKRFSELIALVLIFSSILLLISLISYSPEDPNFIFPENIEIKNILGFNGSFVSDIFFQSIGLISIFVSITIFFIGINLFKKKKFLIIIENLFYTVLYCILGSLFFEIYYPESFWLIINGNGGFVGKFFESSFLLNIINLNEKISYYALILLSLFFFLISTNFNVIFFINLFKKKFKLNKNIKQSEINLEENNNYKSEIIYTEPLVQENLPFTKNTIEQ